MSTSCAATLDVRQIAPRERHPLISSSFETLQPGQALQLVNDHDPLPLYEQFERRTLGRFTWNYLEAGPEVWRVQIGKSTDAAGNCCSGGACCG